MITELVLTAILSPRAASLIAPLLIGEPSIIPAMLKTCERESRCTVVGLHRIDRRLSRAAWEDGVNAGWVDADCQPYHAGWSTRGAWGTMAAYTVHHLGACMPAWVIDVPLVGAIAAARRMVHPKCARIVGCVRWRGF